MCACSCFFVVKYLNHLIQFTLQWSLVKTSPGILKTDVGGYSNNNINLSSTGCVMRRRSVIVLWLLWYRFFWRSSVYWSVGYILGVKMPDEEEARYIEVESDTLLDLISLILWLQIRNTLFCYQIVFSDMWKDHPITWLMRVCCRDEHFLKLGTDWVFS